MDVRVKFGESGQMVLEILEGLIVRGMNKHDRGLSHKAEMPYRHFTLQQTRSRSLIGISPKNGCQWPCKENMYPI